MSASAAPAETFDVLIVGAGLSGVGAAVHLKQRLPDKSFAILEARDRIGGTWDLFRYPGVRSDSDMYTLGYRFKPWTDARAIADGPAILSYIEETAREHGLADRIRFGHKLVRASWSSAEARWTLEIEGQPSLACRFLVMASGYYSYASGHRPTWPGEDDFRGAIVHPQSWPENLDTADKRITVIGSGATAVTLVPALAKQGAHVTMLQRSPTYIVARPSVDRIAEWLRARLPATAAYALTRWKNVVLQTLFFKYARARPERVAAALIRLAQKELGPAFDPSHFTPRYNPWDQRLCLVPDSDLFAALRSGEAEIVTAQIERLTPEGIRLTDGRTLEADLIVTATGLNLQLMGGATLEVDGRPVTFADTMAYKGMMFSGVPNFLSVFGYTNASWTLKADLASEYLCRLLETMDRKRAATAVPVRDASVKEAPFLTFTSTYIQRAAPALPKQGTTGPWRLPQNYWRDVWAIRFGRVDDGVLRFD